MHLQCTQISIYILNNYTLPIIFVTCTHLFWKQIFATSSFPINFQFSIYFMLTTDILLFWSQCTSETTIHHICYNQYTHHDTYTRLFSMCEKETFCSLATRRLYTVHLKLDVQKDPQVYTYHHYLLLTCAICFILN